MGSLDAQLDALMAEVRETERREHAAAKLSVRAWTRRRPGSYEFDFLWQAESDGASISVGNECLLARIPRSLLTVLNGRKFHPGPTRRIRDYIAEDLTRREIPFVTVVPPYPMSTHTSKDLARAWRVHVDRSAADYAEKIKGFARYIIDAWLADRDDHVWYGWVEYSASAGSISVQFDCVITRAEPPSIALVSAKKFPSGKETQIFRDAARDYLKELKAPTRDITVKNRGRYVTAGDLMTCWLRDRPRLISDPRQR